MELEMPTGDKGIDVLVQRAIAAARRRKPGCSPREAAEMTAGHLLSDEEWRRKGPIWLRNWNAGPAGEVLRGGGQGEEAPRATQHLPGTDPSDTGSRMTSGQPPSQWPDGGGPVHRGLRSAA
jgi:hypothetical protein